MDLSLPLVKYVDPGLVGLVHWEHTCCFQVIVIGLGALLSTFPRHFGEPYSGRHPSDAIKGPKLFAIPESRGEPLLLFSPVPS